jgi:hypothetical protein
MPREEILGKKRKIKKREVVSYFQKQNAHPLVKKNSAW